MNGMLSGEPRMLVSFFLLLALKVTLLLGAGFLLSYSVRKASASLRHLLWSATFAALLALPLPAGLALVAGDLRIPLALLPARPEADSSAAPVLDGSPAPAGLVSLHTGAVSAKSPAPRERPSLPSSRSWPTVLLLAWVLGAGLLLARLGAGIVAGIGEVLRAKELSDDEWSDLLDRACARLGVRGEVSLRRSEVHCLPMTLGLFHPTILLPDSARSYGAHRRWAVLLHELAHVRRRDCLALLLAQTASALYWWNPLVWLAAREMRLLSERASDDLVLGTGASPADYAHDLLEMARGLHEQRFSPLASVAMAHRSRFEERLLAILDPGVARRAVGSRSVLGASALALPLFLFVALAVPTRASRPERKETAEAVEATASPEETTPEPERAPERERVKAPPAPGRTSRPEPAPEEQEPASKAKAKAKASPEARDKARAALAEALDDPDPSVSKQALHALVQMGEESVAPHLTHALESADPEVRAEAAWGLGQLQDEASVAALQKALSDENAEVRAQAAWALGMIRSASAIDGLVAALSDADENVREQAVWALGMIRDPRAAAGLSRAVVDADENVRSQAVWALGMLRVPEGYDALVTALSDESADVRSQAAWGLGMLRDSRAIEALSRALKDEDADVREQAAWALGILANGEGEEPEPTPEPNGDPHAVGFTPGTVL
jgi:HEAT repeat protein/beta-lactamase regulating signal transducer with metallopeptidase domain